MNWSWLFAYLDDWLVSASSEARLLVHLQLLLWTAQGLNFLVNWEKLELSPTRTPVYLGTDLEFQSQLACLSPDRIQTITRVTRYLRRAHRVPAKRWLQWLGYLASLVDVFPDCSHEAF